MSSVSNQNRLPSWLDRETSSLVQEMIDLLVAKYPDLLAIVLYGSIARHEERPADTQHTSDVDLLAVFDRDTMDMTMQEREAFFATLGIAHNRYLDVPRDVQFMLSSRTTQEWDPTFIENVRRDGIVLYQRGKLPAPFAA